ncbi:MAG: methyltransferase domain-containing protein [Candidatus Omnitrophota bacterium]|nr:methyltransferase domain-containing protein [Candidatus Omnitrophota bacterium]
MVDQDPRAQLKAAIRRYPWISRGMQWVFDPAFTPTYLIARWARAQDGHILNIGSGSRTIGDRVINLDIEDSAHVHVVNRAPKLPFKDASFEGVLLEYVLEHVENYPEVLQEALRVLKPGGSILATVPFRQNYHACPSDYWRFTYEGLEVVFRRSGFEHIVVEVYGGPVSAWIDATKEFLATLCSVGSPLVYAVLSQIFIIPFIPLRYLDVVLRKLPVAKYTAFSLKISAQKPGTLKANGHAVGLDEKIRQTLWTDESYHVRKHGARYWIEPARVSG